MRKVFVIVVVGALAAACGGGGSNKVKPTLSASPILSPASPPANCTEESSGAVFNLTQHNLAYHPNCVIVKSAQSIHIENKDNVTHNFTIPGTQVNVDIQPGTTFNGESAGLAPGTYPFFCKFHKSLG